MKAIDSLRRLLNSKKSIGVRYPNLDKYDGKTHLLYVGPEFGPTGYYRMIAPAMALSKSSCFDARLTSIKNHDFSSPLKEHDIGMDVELVEWADFIILPALFTEVSYLFDMVRHVNPDMKFVMDLDRIHHKVPLYHPNFGKISEMELDQLLENLDQVDLVTTAHDGISVYYIQKLLDNRPVMDTKFLNIPTILPDSAFQDVFPEIEPNKGMKNGKTRIGILSHGGVVSAVMTIWGYLERMDNHYSESLEFIILDWEGRMCTEHGLKDIIGARYSSQPPVSFREYPETLASLSFDIAILPDVHHPYHIYRVPIRYLEAALLGIPVIAAGQRPYTNVIEHGITGYLAATEEDFFEYTKMMIEVPSIRESIACRARKMAWNLCSLNKKSLKAYKEAFCVQNLNSRNPVCES